MANKTIGKRYYHKSGTFFTLPHVFFSLMIQFCRSFAHVNYNGGKSNQIKWRNRRRHHDDKIKGLVKVYKSDVNIIFQYLHFLFFLFSIMSFQACGVCLVFLMVSLSLSISGSIFFPKKHRNVTAKKVWSCSLVSVRPQRFETHTDGMGNYTFLAVCLS